MSAEPHDYLIAVSFLLGIYEHDTNFLQRMRTKLVKGEDITDREVETVIKQIPYRELR